MPQLTPRLTFTAIFGACTALLAFGYYLQFVQGLEPCPLCIFQRVAYLVVAAVAGIAALHGPAVGGTRAYAGVIALASLIGGGIAARQTWLQHLPADRIPECGPGLEFMLEVYPLLEVIQRAFTASGECAEVQWRFLGLSIAEWSLLWFAALTIAALWLAVSGATRGRVRRA